MIRCRTCAVDKDDEEFGWRRYRSGVLARKRQCKKCFNELTRDAARERMAARMKTPENRVLQVKRTMAWKLRNPERLAAQRQREAERAGRTYVPRGPRLHDAHVIRYGDHRARQEKRAATLHDAHARAFFRTAAGVALRQRRAYASNPKVAIYHRLKRWMHKHCADGIRSVKWSALLGYSVDDLRSHLERQFRRGMGWHNRHRWHIDHIVPVSAFEFQSPTDPTFRAAFALTNLRPVWRHVNQRKGARREFLV